MPDEKKAEAPPQWAVEAAEEIHTYCGDECSALDTKVAIIARHASEREKTLERERDSWRRTAEKLEGEKVRAEAEVASLKRELETERLLIPQAFMDQMCEAFNLPADRTWMGAGLISVAKAKTAEVASLRQSLTKYNADHLKWCAKYNDPKYGPMAYPSPDVECTCGFSVLLAGKGDTL